MSNLQPINNPKNFFEFVFWIINVSIIHFWKITITVLITTTVAIVGVLLAQEKFKSEAIIYIPGDDQGSLSSALGNISKMGLPGLTLPNSTADMDLVLSIIQSRDLLDGVMQRFNLIETDQIDTTQNAWYTSTLKYIRKNIITEITDENAIIIGYQDTSYVRAYDITTYLLFAIDSIYSDINLTHNKMNREFYEGRLNMAKSELNQIMDSLGTFSKEKNIIDLELQIEESVKQIAELEGKARWLSIEVSSLAETPNVSVTNVDIKKSQLRQIQSELKKIKSSSKGTLLLPVANMNTDLNTYNNLFREYKIRESVYQYLRQKLEEKLLDEDKKMGNIIVIQKPWVNKKRISPPRFAIVISVFMLTLLFGTIYAVAKENYRLNREGNVSILIREAVLNFKRHVLLKTWR